LTRVAAQSPTCVLSMLTMRTAGAAAFSAASMLSSRRLVEAVEHARDWIDIG
jgi:hypothetical protein